MGDQKKRESWFSLTIFGSKTRGSRLTTGRSTILLASLILLYAYIPLQQEFQIRGLEYVFIAIVVSMVYTISSSRGRFLVALGLGLLIAVLLIFTDTEEVESLRLTIALYGTMCLFIGYSTIMILYEVTQSKVFDYHMIVSALAAYMLLALLWTIFYTIAELGQPGSFAVTDKLVETMPKEPSSIFELALYFSLITLTSVGYGDITPVSPTARSLATIEPVFGQLLLTVLVAWLVGMYISDSLERREQQREIKDQD